MYETQAENALFCIVPDILYTTVDGIPLYLDIIQPDPLPEERMPVVIYIHGGGWMGGQRKGERNTFLAAHGFFTISIDYRLSNQAIYPAQMQRPQCAGCAPTRSAIILIQSTSASGGILLGLILRRFLVHRRTAQNSKGTRLLKTSQVASRPW